MVVHKDTPTKRNLTLPRLTLMDPGQAWSVQACSVQLLTSANKSLWSSRAGFCNWCPRPPPPKKKKNAQVCRARIERAIIAPARRPVPSQPSSLALGFEAQVCAFVAVMHVSVDPILINPSVFIGGLRYVAWMERL